MDASSEKCWKTLLQCVIYVIALFTRSAYCGEFLYIPFANVSGLNNSMAQSVCESNGTYEVAVIDSQSEYDRMLTFFNQTLGVGFVLPAAVWVGSYWIQNTDNETYTHYWQSDGCSIRMEWAYWAPGEPDGEGSQLCTRIDTYMYMRTYYCSGTFDVLCEKIDSSNSICGSQSPKDECELFAPCWWTVDKVGLTAGFTSLFFLLCVCCTTWKCFCAPKNQVGYDADARDDADDDVRKNGRHDISKNHNIDQAPDLPTTSPPGFNSLVLSDNSWMTPQELSFNARYSYKEN